MFRRKGTVPTPTETYLPVGTFRNVLFYVTGPRIIFPRILLQFLPCQPFLHKAVVVVDLLYVSELKERQRDFPPISSASKV